jgi:DNA-binding transcriptional LysR family regulator
MELRHLRYFVAVAEELNFTRAAQRLHVAQPALSRAVRQLESELGTSLFTRSKRAVTLTEAGRRLVKQAGDLLAQSDRLIENVRLNSEGPLRIGYVWGLFHSILPECVRRFRAAHPEAVVHLFDLSAAEQAKALVHGSLDLGFIGLALEADGARLAKTKIASCEFVAVLPRHHRAAKRKTVQLRDMAEESFIIISEKTYPGAAQKITETCAQAGFRPKILQAPERGHTVISLVAAGAGVALLPSPLQELPHSGVIFRGLEESPEIELFLAWNRKVGSAARDRFLSMIQK